MKQLKILIVEDSPTIRMGLVSVLRKIGADVTQASDGSEGLETARASHFDLIITDIDMPVMNGLQLCQELKKNPNTLSIPIVILSTEDSECRIEEGFRVGASAYINKMNAPRELKPCIEELLFKSEILHNRLILVVDDSVTIRSLVKEGLIQAGFQVIAAGNGIEALSVLESKAGFQGFASVKVLSLPESKKADANQSCIPEGETALHPDVILCDLEMPDMDGISFFETLQSRPEWAGIPFVVMSSISDRSTMRRMMQKGASAYLVKPFNIGQSVITIEKLLSDHYQVLLREKERFVAERNLMLGSITSLIQALEARDLYTRGHSDSVAKIASAMGRQMKLSSREIECIEIAGKLHDIGKIGIRDDLLLKSDRLTEAEFQIIKQHPIIGANILKPIPSLADIIPAVLHHHEHLNGKGYPSGLKGNQIPLRARIIAVGDTYHALTSNRPYRKGMTHKEAVSVIRHVSGTQLCPECVRVFLECAENSELKREGFFS